MSKTKKARNKSGNGQKPAKVYLKGHAPKTRVPPTPVNGLSVTRPAMGDVEFKSPYKRGTIYQPVLDMMAKCKFGEKPIQVEIPAGISCRVMHNRLNAVIRRVGPKAPKGSVWQKRTAIADGKEVVLIFLAKEAKEGPKAA